MQSGWLLRAGILLAIGLGQPEAWLTATPGLKTPGLKTRGSFGTGQQSPFSNGQQTAAAAAGTGVFMGRVVDADTGEPIGGAVVSLLVSGAGMPIEPVLTDDRGRFAFRDLRAGSYRVRARHAGYVDGTYVQRLPDEEPELERPLVLREDERIGDATLLMWKHASISGTVIDDAGEPLVDVPVRVLRRRILAGREAFDITVNSPLVRTDDRGIFRLGELTPGDFVVALPVVVASVPRPRVQSGSSAPPSPDSWTGASRWLMKGFGPIRTPGADIGDPDAIFAERSTSGGGISAFAGLDRDGRPLVYATQFFPGVTRLTDATLITLRAGEERSGVNFQVKPVRGVRISGTVVAAGDLPGELLVRLVPTDFAALDSDVEVAQATCTPDGRFVFLGVPPGDYSIRIDRRLRAGDRAVVFADTPLSVGDQDVSGVNVQLRAGLHVRGRARFEGAGSTTPPRFGLYIESADGAAPANGTLQTSQVDAEGTFVTTGRRPGSYLLRVMVSAASSSRGWFFKGAMLGGRDISVVPVELRDADVDDVVLVFSDKPNAEISGVVVNANGPDASASVIVFPVDRERWTNTGVRPRALRLVGTDSRGSYRVSDLPPGEYFVAATATVLSTWADPASLQLLARAATRVQLADGEKKALELRLR